jgi:DNA-binding MltR family transcriptional regulator
MSKDRASNLESIIKDESQAFWDAINGEDDLSCVLIAVSYIEQCLESLLRRSLVDGDITNSIVDHMPLKRKLDLLFSLGHIPKPIHENIKHLASIRNHFAHSHFQASFADEQVVSLLAKIKVKTGLSGPLSARDNFVTSSVICSQVVQVHGLSAITPSILEWKGL